MRLTTRSRYALVALADVALRDGRGPVPLATISLRHRISVSYLEMLFSALRRAGLVVSTRGPGGGYTLGRKASDITVADIAHASEQGKSGQTAADYDTMTARQGAMTHALWQQFNQAVSDHLESVTLADVVAGHSAAEHGACGARTEAAAGQDPTASAPQKPARRQLPQPDVPNSVFALGTVARAR